MQRVKEAAKFLKLYPKLKLGEKTNHGVISTGPHKVKITAEPTTTTMTKGKTTVKAFKFIVEEAGELRKWLVPLQNEAGEGHYLIEHLQDVAVGEEITLEMKKKGPRNYIEVKRAGDEQDDETEINDEIIDEHEGHDIQA